MEYRQLGGSGLMVPALSFGTGTFGGGTEFFNAWGASDVAEATRLVDICLDVGLNMFDSADIYSNGAAEEILGQAIQGRRDRASRARFGAVSRCPRRVGCAARSPPRTARRSMRPTSTTS